MYIVKFRASTRRETRRCETLEEALEEAKKLPWPGARVGIYQTTDQPDVLIKVA
jgi:hypothetical protein